jgi:ABC-type polysaccharide/polyol phosphate transport system ATPase subunit
MEASHTDDMIMLKDTKFPLSSMSLFALIGSTGSGKTF